MDISNNYPDLLDCKIDINGFTLTFDGTPGKQFDWENLADRFGFPPTHRYTSAAPGPSGHPAFLPEKFLFCEFNSKNFALWFKIYAFCQ